MTKTKFILYILFFLGVIQLNAQPAKELIQVIVSPDHADWTYETGEKAVFTISVLRNSVPLDGIEVNFRIQPEKMDGWEEGTVKLKDGKVTLKAIKFNEPGFLRCHASVEIDGKTYSSYSTAGFSPKEIQPTTTLPDDFKEFWDKGKEELAKIPVNPVLTLMPERCTAKADVYQVCIDNIEGKIYGILCKPKAEGKYPAILHVPGAGVAPVDGDITGAENGFVTFQIGIHGIPVDLDPKLYTSLRYGALNNYWTANMDDKDHYYYRRVYLGCVRAVDFIETLDCFDGENIGVTGASQGGALSIITAGLDKRIDYLAAFVPALCDLTGFLHGRAGGWPQMFRDDFTNKPEKVETSKYYDAVNFARFIKAPGWYSWGYNDNVCPPSSTFSAYNVIHAKKELHVFQETRHWTFPEQRELRDEWLYSQLKNSDGK
ncbi:acetylxylan esterase [Draconibacterium sp. IB214405]|uniref:acetylxylan esterase n=1 Tax=Draconibacterium sp. IB214405 TaxID=3097352 RepID=UPI002A0D0091|nr:acetylxylan esterase [Draconibacterium sp. IB214405]MDX8339629.1 acetylxylan esterase [Draconibacterium sp. IB214405]